MTNSNNALLDELSELTLKCRSTTRATTYLYHEDDRGAAYREDDAAMTRLWSVVEALRDRLP